MTITFDDFLKVDIRVGTIIDVQDFPEAKKPAWILTVDFGDAGVKRSSAQITVHYSKEDLLGRQVIGVINFPPKRIGPFSSECLITGFHDNNGDIVLAVPERVAPNGMRLC